MAELGRGEVSDTIVDKQFKDDKRRSSIIERAKTITGLRKRVSNRVLTGQLMEQIRIASGASQSLVSRDLGVSITAYRQWETDTAIPTEKSYRALEDYFCVYNEDDVAAVLSAIENTNVINEQELNELIKEMID
jgi:DNA-binding transcriptional regulator YiaG